MTAPDIRSASLADDDALQAFVEHTLRGPTHRQMWLFFLDDDGRQVGPLFPCDDYPSDPHELIRTPDLGLVTTCKAWAAVFVQVMREAGLAQVVMVWERPGGDRVGREEADWARALGGAILDAGERVRGHVLLHSRGARVLAPDDLV